MAVKLQTQVALIHMYATILEERGELQTRILLSVVHEMGIDTVTEIAREMIDSPEVSGTVGEQTFLLPV